MNDAEHSKTPSIPYWFIGFLTGVLLGLLSGGCATPAFTPVPPPFCVVWGDVKVINDGERSCEDVARLFDLAAEVAAKHGAMGPLQMHKTAKRFSIVVLDTDRLYPKYYSEVDWRVVRGLTVCDKELPRIILDRTMYGLLAELINARECAEFLDGKTGQGMAQELEHRAAWEDFARRAL